LGFGTNFVPQAPWDETTSNNTPGDRRGVGTSGPFTFEAGEALCLDYAYLYARGNNGPQSSVVRLRQIADSARTWYDPQPACACTTVSSVGIAESVTPARPISLYPNPASGTLFVNYEVTAVSASWEIIDLTGRIVDTGLMGAGNSAALDVSALPAGLYLLRITDGKTSSTARFTK
jgi:hypothetical protein